MTNENTHVNIFLALGGATVLSCMKFSHSVSRATNKGYYANAVDSKSPSDLSAI